MAAMNLNAFHYLTLPCIAAMQVVMWLYNGIISVHLEKLRSC